MNTQIFDRELETIEISKLLQAHQPRAICISGLSGVGKSALVSKCIADLPTLSFSFKETIRTTSPFSSFIISQNRRYSDMLLEKYTRLKPKDVRVGLFGFSTSMEISPQSIDALFFEYFLERLHRSGFRCLRIDNIELYTSEADIAALKVLGDLKEPHLKLVFEVGTLAPLNRRLSHLPLESSHRAVFGLEPFTQDKTIGLYRFIHHSEPPHDIFQQSAGLPLAIEHQIGANLSDASLEWIRGRLDGIDPEAYSLAYALSNFNEPCSASDLESIHEGGFTRSLLQLMRSRIVEEADGGLRFAHPAFRHILRQSSAGYLDRQFLSKVFSIRITKSSRSVEEEISLVTIAARLGDPELVKKQGFESIIKTYPDQNALQLLYVSDVLLKNALLNERQRRIIAIVNIQALCQLNRLQEAKKVLDLEVALLREDRRSIILNAMILTLSHDWKKSNELISTTLTELDSRARDKDLKRHTS